MVAATAANWNSETTRAPISPVTPLWLSSERLIDTRTVCVPGCVWPLDPKTNCLSSGNRQQQQLHAFIHSFADWLLKSKSKSICCCCVASACATASAVSAVALCGCTTACVC